MKLIDILRTFILGCHMKREFEDDKGNQCQEEPTDTCNETMLFRKPEFIWGNRYIYIT